MAIKWAVLQGTWGYVGLALTFTVIPLGLGYLGTRFDRWERNLFNSIRERVVESEQPEGEE